MNVCDGIIESPHARRKIYKNTFTNQKITNPNRKIFNNAKMCGLTSI